MCEKLKEIREQVYEAAVKAGRDPSRVTIVAVSKKKPAEMVHKLYECGQLFFGENYVQEAISKIEELSAIRPRLIWHFIGHLQRNKAKLAAKYFDCIETVDSIKLAKALDKHASALGRGIDCLIQVNIGKDPAKAGVAPEELGKILSQMEDFQSLRVKGLMTMHPWSSTRDEARKWFRKLRQLRDGVVAQGLPSGICLDELSMGMSRDFVEAVQEGATIVRIGTALFGPRE